MSKLENFIPRIEVLPEIIDTMRKEMEALDLFYKECPKPKIGVFYGRPGSNNVEKLDFSRKNSGCEKDDDSREFDE